MQNSPASTAFDELMAQSQWSLKLREKEDILLAGINELTSHHAASCNDYYRILNALWKGIDGAKSLEDVPFLPVSLFKTNHLVTAASDDIRMTMTSSGTTGAAVSQIAIDHETSKRQTKALNASISSVVGGKRPAMLVVDTEAVVSDPRLLSARGAGVLGMMRFGRDHCFLLDSDMNFRVEALKTWLEKHNGQPILIFGFTFLVWQYLHRFTTEYTIDLSKGVLVHSGGWKKLESQAVNPEVFRNAFLTNARLSSIFNFYGMVEQMGAIFLEGDDGLLYPPNIADVIIRDPMTLEPLPTGQQGLIQLVGLIPTSYPGHSILTEDLGVIEHVDQGVGGRMGKALRIIGRLPKTELRGCSDVVATDMATRQVRA